MRDHRVRSHPLLTTLVEKYGSESVYAVSDRVLGYPATFITTDDEVLQLSSQLWKNHD